MDDHALATEAARRAGDFLVELRARGGTGAEGDRQADDLILAVPARAPARRRDPLRGVEGRPGAHRRGTRVDRRPARRHARVRRGRAHRLGGARRARRGPDAGRGRGRAPCAGPRALDATRADTRAADRPDRSASSCRAPGRRSSPTRLADLLDAELVPMGSAGAKATAVLLGAGDVYAHGGGQYEWDSAAPVGVANAAGCSHVPARRLAAALQPARPVPARPARLPPRARRPGPRRHRPRHCLKHRGPCRARLANGQDRTQAARYSVQAPHGVWRSLVSAQRSGR